MNFRRLDLELEHLRPLSNALLAFYVCLSVLILYVFYRSSMTMAMQRDLEKGVSLREITKKVTREVERDIIKQTLEKANGNKTRTAKILKIDRMTLYSKLKEFQL